MLPFAVTSDKLLSAVAAAAAAAIAAAAIAAAAAARLLLVFCGHLCAPSRDSSLRIFKSKHKSRPAQTTPRTGFNACCAEIRHMPPVPLWLL